MFLVNSRYRRFSATPFRLESKSHHVMGAHLLPKLRCQFAEFLNQSSLKRLGMLSLPTCVGLGYGRPVDLPSSFSWKYGIDDFASSKGRSTSPLGLDPAFYSYGNGLQRHTDYSISRMIYLSPSLLCSTSVVQEYLPASHRLRLSAIP